MGAWIEIIKSVETVTVTTAAPFMGAWIEITLRIGRKHLWVAAPFMGAWIEIFFFIFFILSFLRRTLHGCVD